MKFSGKVGNGPMNKWLNFSSDPDHRLDTGIVFRILHYWEIRKVVLTGCAARRCMQCRACTIRHRHNNYDVITSPAHDRQPQHSCNWRRYACTVPVLRLVNIVAVGLKQFDYILFIVIISKYQ